MRWVSRRLNSLVIDDDIDMKLCIYNLYHHIKNDGLTFKRRETHGCVVSTVATDAQVLKHQAISILITD